MNFKTLFFGVAAVALAAGGAVYASGYAATETSAPQRAAADNHIPGELPAGKWTYTIAASNDGVSVGYIKNGATASIDFTCDETGAYEMTWNCTKWADGNVLIEVTDLSTGDKEISQNWAVASGDHTIALDGLITAGEKNLKFTITSDQDGYIMDYKTPSFTKVSDEYKPFGIPGTLSLKGWSCDGTRIEDKNGVYNIGYVKNNTSASTEFTCLETGVYDMSLTTKLYDGGTMNISIIDLKTGAKEINQNWTIADGDCNIPLQGLIKEGEKSITLSFTSESSGFIVNLWEPTFTKTGDTYEETEAPEGWDIIPGEIPLTHWTYGGGNTRLENENTNVGWVQNGAFATSSFFCSDPGVYALDIDFYWFNAACDFTITITDDATAKKEIAYTYTIEGAHHPEIILPGLITKGRKSIRFDVSSTDGGFLVNWKVPTFKKVGESFAQLYDLTVNDTDIMPGEMEGYDYAFTIPMDYSASTVTFTPDVKGATATYTASGNVTVTDNGDGTYSIPTPAPNTETVVTATLNAEEGAYKDKEQYSIRFFRIGGVMVAGITVDSFSLDETAIEALNNDEEVTVSDYVFTALPAVTATFLDGSQSTATSKLEGTKATYTFAGQAGDKEKTFTLAVDGIHIYTATGNDKSADLRYDSAYNQSNDTWSNGLYTIDPANDGWGGTQFKFNYKNGRKITLTCPNDMKVNQLVFASLFDNYADGKITSVTSGDATVWLPSASTFATGGPGYNLVINVENHVAGTPFVIEYEGGSQPVMWFEFLYEIAVPTDAPALLKSGTTDLTGKNHTVVSFTFNREVEATEVEFNGTTATSHVTGTTLNFPLWDLEYETEYTLTLPTGAVIDKYGNKTTEELSVTFTTGKEDFVESHDTDRFIRVSTVAELRAAVAGLSKTNGSAASPATIIYIANGDYDLGSDDATAHLDINKVYNVSLIGQSEDRVLIHGTRTGISYPILSTRNSTNIYMENFTVRNDLDFGKAERVGVGVAHYGGNLDIMKNVTLQSIQDTQVTGERGYYYNVTIHGNVDYICGGGDHFYDHCTLIQEGEGGFITAPSTSTANKHGYVFSNCTIKGDNNYYLGRPWHEEPRCYWLNTTMLALPKTEGWGPMSDLPTHFYEYNSMDADGNPLDPLRQQQRELHRQRHRLLV
ncbi:MAG: hypothetical protein K2H98_05985, partial [Duncaniella sp.]|nr:hypothetical protein [Duncaniella sp.]